MKYYKVWSHSQIENTQTEIFQNHKEALQHYKLWKSDMENGETIELSSHKDKQDWIGETIRTISKPI